MGEAASPEPQGATPGSSLRVEWAWLLAFLVPLLALLLVRPWVREPFAVWDFGELLPVLRQSSGLFDAIVDLGRYYGADGRANYLTYAQITLTWVVAGDNPIGWQVQRALFMLVAATLFVGVARRAGATPGAAAAGGLLAVIGASAMEGWTLLVGEPLAAILLLGIAWLAMGYRDAKRWKGRGILLGLLALGVLQAKEVLGVCLPVLVVVALCADHQGVLRIPRRDARSLWLVAIMTVALVVELAILLPALGALSTEGYASGYGQGGLADGRFGDLALAMTLPSWFASSSAGALLYPANAAAAILLVCGAALWIRRRPRSFHLALLLALLPLLGAAVYAPWPRYAPFYGFPFWLGSLAAVVASTTMLQRAGRFGRRAGLGLLLVAAAFAAMVSDRSLKERHAHAAVAELIVEDLPAWAGVDTVLVVVPASGPRRWPVTGPELRRYAGAIRPAAGTPPLMMDITCEAAAGRLASGLRRAALVSDPRPCGPLPARTALHLRAYRYLDWVDFRWRHDTVAVESLVPALLGTRPGSTSP